MSINQIENMTDNTTMLIAIVFIAVIAILVAIASILQKKTVNKKPLKSFDDLTCAIPSYKDQMVKFMFDESIRDLSKVITLSDTARAVVNTYNK